MSASFSFQSRGDSLRRFRQEEFDLLVIGGGITGAGVARDAASRGLKVALVERRDFAYGTSSRSSKLIHGGLRYLEKFELKLVFEALSERTLLLKTVPHLVRPLPFYMPVYQGDRNGRTTLSVGLWLYDLLALFRAPGFHKRLSAQKLKGEIPALNPEGLKGGFRYYDASMWDDVLTVETLRDAQRLGAAISNYVEAVEPIWEGEVIRGFKMAEKGDGSQSFDVRAKKVVLCGGPWTDELASRAASSKKKWRPWLQPSKGVHLIFDKKRLPVPGALVMSHPEDGRIAFVIPRVDYGPGVVIVGTTDGPISGDPAAVHISSGDVTYLLRLLDRYFPSLKLTAADVQSAYVGVRPLVGSTAPSGHAEDSTSLQKVSREHHIDFGPGGTVVVAGGKYTTYRKMAEEIVDFTVGRGTRPQTAKPMNPAATHAALELAREAAQREGKKIPEEIWNRYGGEALEVERLRRAGDDPVECPEGFPWLDAQLRFAVRYGMVLKLEDFFLRRIPLYASRKDGGMPWAKRLATVLAEERGFTGAAASDFAEKEKTQLEQELNRRSAWRKEV